MLEQLFNVTNDGTITTAETLICLVVALIFGLVIAGTYALSNKKESTSISFFLTLIVLPAIVSLIIVLVSGDAAKALSIAGVFTLVRFRSQPGEGKDLCYILISMGAGLAAGMNYFSVAALAVVILCLIMILVSRFGVSFFSNEVKSLKILIPEDMNYNGAFDDIFENYTLSRDLEKVKTTNMGTLYELTYNVKFKKDADEKKFLDELRTRNSNLSITLAKLVKKDTTL
jgi:uncharacterized membrane protein YhiD involved in acid resistance